MLARTITQALGPKHRTLFMATDVNDKAAQATLGTGLANGVAPLEAVQGDLLTVCLPWLDGKVDVLVFNPPYVPTPSEEVGGRYVGLCRLFLGICADEHPARSIASLTRLRAHNSGIEAAWAGGKDGREVVDRLLPDVPVRRLPAHPPLLSFPIKPSGSELALT